MPFGNRKRKVLDEDKYLADLEYIIKRDFFPHSEAIELNLKYYDALDKHDFSSLKEIQMKLNLINDSFTRHRSNYFTEETESDVPYKNPNAKEERDLSLDEYLARNTSEDNNSFRELQKKTVEKQLKKFESSVKAAREYYKSIKDTDKIMPLAIEYKKSRSDNSQHESFEDIRIFNPVFFNPDNTPLSSEEKINLSGKKSQINYEAFRFKSPLETLKRKTINPNVKQKVPGKVGHDGKEIKPNSTPKLHGYSILGRSPSPENTPEFTWGEIDGTPQNIKDSPPISKFYIPEPSETEKLANELANQISQKKRQKKKEEMERIRSAFSRRSGSSRTHLTPAGMKLLSMMTPTISSCNNLESYKRSKLMNTPSVRLTPTPQTSRTNRNPDPPNHSITDDLLDLN